MTKGFVGLLKCLFGSLVFTTPLLFVVQNIFCFPNYNNTT